MDKILIDAIVNDVLNEDKAKMLLHKTETTESHNGISYEMIRKELVFEIAARYAATQSVPLATEDNTLKQEGEQWVNVNFDSNNYYWCKCEGCGWEGSSEHCAGGNAIADTGDHSDVLCPICFNSKLDGEPVIDTPQYEGIVNLKMPLDLILTPYLKIIRQYQKVEDDKHWEQMCKMAEFIEGERSPSQQSGYSREQVLKIAGEAWDAADNFANERAILTNWLIL